MPTYLMACEICSLCLSWALGFWVPKYLTGLLIVLILVIVVMMLDHCILPRALNASEQLSLFS